MSFEQLVAMPPDNSKKAALLLHAMAPSDRDWLLSQLPQSERHALQELLAQLLELNIPADESLLDSVLGDDHGAEIKVRELESNEDAVFLMNLDAYGVAALAGAFQRQPPRLIARALSLRPWRWRMQVLDKLPKPLRDSVIDAMRSISQNAPSDNALAIALLAAMRQCCEQAITDDMQLAQQPPKRSHLLLGAWSKKWFRRRS